MNYHHCHARGCTTPCKPERLMCLKHWKMVPAVLQADIWRTYRPGQCDDKQPSEAWHKAADAAIQAVWELEQKRGTKRKGKDQPKVDKHREIPG